MRNLDCSSALSIRIFLSVFGYCIVDSLTAFSVICNKTFYKVYTLLSHTPHHTKSPLGSRGRDRWAVTFSTARRGLRGAADRPGPSELYQRNSPPINSQCKPITVLLYGGPLLCGFNVPVKGLTKNEPETAATNMKTLKTIQ